MKFEITKPDYEKNPYTGMGRSHWLEVSHFYLEGIFKHVKSIDSPIIVPKHSDEVGYPNPTSPAWRLAAERFEGLARSFLIAAPLLHNEPEAVVGGYALKTYYKQAILNGATPGHPSYLLSLEQIMETAENGERAFQHTCECASLTIGLYMCKSVIWDTYTQAEKDTIAAYLSEFGHSYTGHHNWRLFNMLILAFLSMEGYTINEETMRDHAATILSYYAGDGWYRDGHLFDYYCPWAFHVYGPLWNVWYGYEKEPYIASKIEAYSNTFVETYPRFFDQDAHVTMWGRSSIYRSAAAAPLAANFLLKKATANAGLARRIASGSLLQFATKEECFYEGVPSLGFYKPFSPLVQSYSCAASPFWLANTFVCLYLPEDHPFWTAKEENGVWEELNNTHTVLDAPGIVLDNHLENGFTEFRTGKTSMRVGNTSLNSYSRVAFHSGFTWEDFSYEGEETMQYSLQYEGVESSSIPNLILYGREKECVLYRKQYFDYVDTFQNQASIDLADFTIPYGHLRVDKMRIPDKPYRLTFGSYGMPLDREVTVQERKEIGGANGKAIILRTSRGQIALVTYKGFDNMATKRRKDVSPVSDESMLIYAETTRKVHYAYKDYVLISAILTKNNEEEWTDEELFPVAKMTFTDKEQCGGYGPIEIRLKNGESYTVDYEGLEGHLRV